MTDRFFEGTRVGRYELVTRLSIGGMAELFLARLDGLGGFKKLVALKTILPDVSNDERFREMFLDEARVSAELSHPNLGQVFDLGQEPEGPLYLAMEFLTGRDLGAVLKACQSVGRPLPLAVTGRIIRDVCQGLHAAHSHTDGRGQPRPVIHRDVAPKNVMVTFDGAVKVIDFGIAHAFGRATRTQTGIVKGTPSYMAPEQLTGERPTVSVDVYAVGVMLHECLTGRRLFTPDAPLARFSPITPPSAMVPGLSPALDAVVLRALEVEPARRFQSTRDFAKALSEAMPRMAEADDLAELMQALFPGQHASLTALSESARQGDPSREQLAEVARSGVYSIAALTRPETPVRADTDPESKPQARSRVVEQPAVVPPPRSTTTATERPRVTETRELTTPLPQGWTWALGAAAAGALVLVAANALWSDDEPAVKEPDGRSALAQVPSRQVSGNEPDTSPEAEARMVAEARALLERLQTDDAELLLRQCTRAGKGCPEAVRLIEQLHDERGAGRLLRQAREALGRGDLSTASTMLEAAKGTKLFATPYAALKAELEAKRLPLERSSAGGVVIDGTQAPTTERARSPAGTQGPVDQLLAEARAANKERRYGVAIQLLNRCLQLDSLNPECNVLLASTYAGRGAQDSSESDNQRARQYYLRFLAVAPADDQRRPRIQAILGEVR
ncbi:MAG: serine/threonine-protein kinase [Myxococcaceae bacterium]|nr:serine/threonine-protein kinase [Myxococcaceae bacterium]